MNQLTPRQVSRADRRGFVLALEFGVLIAAAAVACAMIGH